MRIIIRNMRKPVMDYIFNKTKQKVFSAILLNPDKWWYLTDLAKHLRTTPSSLQRELAGLKEADVLLSKKDGNRVYYKANEDCPFLEDLQGLLIKTIGIADHITQVLNEFKSKIEFAFIYGSVAKKEEISKSDVDLCVIGITKLSEISPKLSKIEKKLMREVNPSIYSKNEFTKKLKNQNHFIKEIITDKKIFLIGKENEFNKIFKQ